MVDLSVLSSFGKWSESIISSIVKLQTRINIDMDGCTHLLDMVKQSASMYYISGIAEVLVYRWDTGEPKIIPVWGGKYIIQQDLYWLSKYPFLSETNIAKDQYELTNSTFADVDMPFKGHVSYLMVSHNNHFGHFIIDCLPGLICWDACGRNGLTLQAPLPFNYKDGIYELLQSCGLKSTANCSCLHRHYRMSALALTETMPANIFTAAYLWSQIGPRFKRSLIIRGLNRGLSLMNPPKRIFLGRTGKYSSRIANSKQLTQYLKTLGFIFVDPSTTKAAELAITLSASELIVSESGSTTLNAVVFSAKNTRIISLCSERLFTSTDRSMLHGGLPYMVAFCDQIEFVLGKPVTKSPIQSSDICVYDVDHLNSVLMATN